MNSYLKVKNLVCSCCGRATKGRQWHNRDKGFGLCDVCADWIGKRESSEKMQDDYGIEGVHYKISSDDKSS